MDGNVDVRVIDVIFNETGGDGDEVGGSYSPIRDKEEEDRTLR